MTENFTITAWDPDGQGTTKILGPIYPNMLRDDTQSYWTTEEDTYLTANYKRMTDPQMACELDRTAAAIKNRRGRLGLMR